MIYLLGFFLFEALWFFPYRKVFQAARFSGYYAYLALLPIIGPLALHLDTCVSSLASEDQVS